MFLDSKGVMLVKHHPYENRKDNHTVDQTSKVANVSSNVTLGSFMDIQFSVDQEKEQDGKGQVRPCEITQHTCL